MKTPIFLLSLLLCAATSQAQAPVDPIDLPIEVKDETPARAADAARPVEFGFNSEFNVVQNSFTWTRISDDGNSRSQFSSYESSVQGIPTSENIVLFDADNRPLLTWKIGFDGDGKIQRQDLTGANNEPLAIQGRDLNSLRVEGSGISVETTFSQERLVKRVFTMKYPTWSGQLTSSYDNRGRRARDEFVSSTQEGTNVINYAYSERGLIEIKADSDGTQKRVEIQRNEAGQNTQTRVFDGTELVTVSKPLLDETGKTMGSRSEFYRDGAVDGITELLVQQQGDSNTITITQFDAAGTTQSRQGQTNGRLVYRDEFEDGKLRQRVDFGADEQAIFVTRYKDDGSVEWKKAVGPDGQLQDEQPAQN